MITVTPTWWKARKISIVSCKNAPFKCASTDRQRPDKYSVDNAGAQLLSCCAYPSALTRKQLKLNGRVVVHKHQRAEILSGHDP